MSSLLALTDEVHEYRALARMNHRRMPHVGMSWNVAGGEYRLVIRVEGEDVVDVTAASLENAARKAREDFAKWADDNTIEAALPVTLAGMHADAGH